MADELVGRKLVGEDDVRPLEHAAGGDAAERARQLHRRDLDGALADADRDRLARVPLVMLGLQLPLGGGHDAGGLVGKIDAGLLRRCRPRRHTCAMVSMPSLFASV